MSFIILYRRSGLRSSMSASERAKLIRMKAQMEQQIQALDKQIHLEEIKLFARINKSQQHIKALRYEDLSV